VGAELERQNLTVFLGKGLESTMEGFFSEMEMTNNWERRWAGRKVLGCLTVDQLESYSDEEKREGNG
jgi:hypothetical protein